MVTGSSGFVGNRTMERLNPSKVLGLDLNPSGLHMHNSLKIDIANFAQIDSITVEEPIAAIIHTASIISSQLCQTNPFRALQVNYTGTLNLLEFARKNDIERFIYLSSGGIYGSSNSDEIIRETYELKPTGIYAISKIQSEWAIAEYSKLYSIKGIALRITAPYGPGMNGSVEPYLLGDAINRHTLIFGVKCVKGENINMPYGGDHTINYTYIDDIIDAIILSINAKIDNFEAFNITSGVNYSISELGQIVNEICPNIKINIGSGDLLNGDSKDIILSPIRIKQGIFDITKAKNKLGFMPSYSLKSGMEFLIDYLKPIIHKFQY